MKASFIKSVNDKNNYLLAKGLGIEIVEIDNPENIDSKIEQLEKQDYKTIIIPNDLASFSQSIIHKYSNNTKTNIVIVPIKHKNE